MWKSLKNLYISYDQEHWVSFETSERIRWFDLYHSIKCDQNEHGSEFMSEAAKVRPCRRLNCQSSTRWIWNHLRASPYQLHFLLGRNKVKVGGEIQFPTSFLGYPVAQSDQWKIHYITCSTRIPFRKFGPPIQVWITSRASGSAMVFTAALSGSVQESHVSIHHGRTTPPGALGAPGALIAYSNEEICQGNMMYSYINI